MSGVYKDRLYKEKAFLQHQFPMVTPVNTPPTVYEGMVRCEKGPVKELADKGIWPFTEYVNWQRFRLELHKEYPLKPPIATWLSDISHPNIVPLLPGVVCVSILGKEWKPDLKLVSVVNSMYYLLVDPNPNDVWNHPKCLRAAEICRNYGFPKRGGEVKPAAPSDIVRFNIIPVPRVSRAKDVTKFKILDRKQKGRK